MTTLLKKVKLSGVGIHSGLPVNMTILQSKKPGIFFKRTDTGYYGYLLQIFV